MLAAASQSAFAYGCAQHDPAWKAVEAAANRVRGAKLIEDADRQPLLDQFMGLQQTVQSLVDGSHPLCQDQDALDEDHEQFKEDESAFLQEQAGYTRDCTTVDDDAAKQACDQRRQVLEQRQGELRQRHAGLVQRAKDIQQRKTDLNDDLTARGGDFRKSAQVLLTSLPEEAGELVAAMDHAARVVDPGTPPNLSPQKAETNCNLFFRAVGADLKGTTAPEWSDRSLLANAIGAKIAANTADWQELKDQSDIELQKRANKGEVVVGVYINPHGHGHLAIVTPVPPGLDFTHMPGSGPFVRDGNVHVVKKQGNVHPNGIAPLGRGAARASYAFSEKRWYLWKPSVH